MKKEESKMNKEEIRHIAEALVEELRECEDGYITTTGQLPNAETIAALEEVKELKKNPHKKTYSSFAELLEDLDK